jgi:hypothetical protein
MKSRYTVDVETFIARNPHAEIGWPPVRRMATGCPSRPRMLIWGELTVELPIRVAAPITPRLVSCWRKGELPGREWDVGKPSLAGLVATAGPLAAQLRCDVQIATVIPLPTPALIRTFLENRQFDSRHVVAYPGPAPLSVKLQFADRCVAIVHPGVIALAAPPVPSDLSETFEVVLVDAGRPEGRGERLESLVESCRRGNRGLSFGVVGRADLSADELRILSRSRCWLFLIEAQAREAAGRTAGDGVQPRLAEAIRELKRHLGPGVRLVVSSRDGGICLMNGARAPRLFAAPRVAAGRADGARHVLSVYTLLSSMRGSSDEAALQEGVEAAADHVVGRPPAISVGRHAPAIV